jgi:dTDP-4-dehydrorhamnose 3,5-epimerase
MEITESKIEGVYLIKNFKKDDNRGAFCKTFHKEGFDEHGLCSEFAESYYSISKKGVIRGMHFQLPPSDHEKLVYVPKGQILDIVLDLRKESKTYGACDEFLVSEENGLSIYIPKGCAHGFRSLDEGTITVYNVASVYNAQKDFGIRWDSFGYDWGIEVPIISQRDNELKVFTSFDSPF